MNHNSGDKCKCSVFRNKNISLKILAIHQILVEIEESLLKSRENIDKLKNKYRETPVEKFTFHAKITIETPSTWYRGYTYVFTECSISSLFDVLEIYLHPYYFYFIEMFDQKTYEVLRLKYIQNPHSVNYFIHPVDNK